MHTIIMLEKPAACTSRTFGTTGEAITILAGDCWLRPKDACRMSDFGCENAQAIASAPNVFTTMGEMATKRCNWQPSRGYPHGLLGPSCHLFARK